MGYGSEMEDVVKWSVFMPRNKTIKGDRVNLKTSQKPAYISSAVSPHLLLVVSQPLLFIKLNAEQLVRDAIQPQLLFPQPAARRLLLPSNSRRLQLQSHVTLSLTQPQNHKQLHTTRLQPRFQLLHTHLPPPFRKSNRCLTKTYFSNNCSS